MRGYRAFKFIDFSKNCKYKEFLAQKIGVVEKCGLEDSKYQGCDCCPTFCIPWYRDGKRVTNGKL